jgi:predicted dehydrogenase
MESPPLRVAILGCGQVSADHLVGWSRCRGARVVAACDAQRDRAQARADRFGIPAVYDDPVAMFERERPDAVDIITPRETHAGMVRLAARHGIHALCEKPLCPTLDEARTLIAEVGGRIRLMVNENWRYRGYHRQIGQWIHEGRLGTLVHARISLWRANMLPDEQGTSPAVRRQPFVANEQRLAVAETLIHDLDVARALFGELRVVAARLARASGEIVGEDTAVMLLESPDGLTAIVEGVLSAAGHPIRAGDRVELAGTRCSVAFDKGVLRLFGAEEATLHYDEDDERQRCFDASIQHFVDGLASGAPFWTSAEDQLGTLRLVEDAYALAGPLRRRVPRA